MNLNNLFLLCLYLVGVFILAITFRHILKKRPCIDDGQWKKQLEEEHQAQFVRNKPLDPSLFFEIDSSLFPDVLQADCHQQYLTLMTHAHYPMVHLKSTSNLSLKQLYGPQIIQSISDYEQNYNVFMQTAIGYAQTLINHGFEKEAQLVLEICLDYECDLSKCYFLLINLYKHSQNHQGIKQLQATVQNRMADSLFLPQILNELNMK